MPRLVRLTVLAIAMACSVTAAAQPRRIVSMNMCADQLLIELADHSQIAALTELSRDPVLSFHADRAQSYPVAGGSAEEVLMLRPDLVVSPPFQRKEALSLLNGRSVKIVTVGFADSLEAIYADIRRLAGAIGHPARGEAMIRRMEADLERLSQDRPGKGRIAAYYQRRGYLTGTGTLIDEIMERAGLVNLAERLGRPALSRLSLEEMARSRPDFLLMESATRRVNDRGSEMLHHPALDHVVPPERRLYLPQAIAVCGGASYPLAVAMLADQIRRSDAGK
ncbi:iron ABC transporter [Tardibacter chloracetimidivorans]|uniref:Iron ABC transporter n=1 Tax=Tardibacter chloracetimidivorans TaxID=1921510 RepID=A0A1L3ZT46_9SPHN|nr:ABC transporter substrate-binding protein [Tardibacter chloracetimidivorans]API58797.1 iron ABC transporter [Tardibacter chloracetimidivorans]